MLADMAHLKARSGLYDYAAADLRASSGPERISSSGAHSPILPLKEELLIREIRAEIHAFRTMHEAAHPELF